MKKTATPKKPAATRARPLVSFTLSLEEINMLRSLSEMRGLTRSATVGQLVRDAYRGTLDGAQAVTRALEARIEASRIARTLSNSPNVAIGRSGRRPKNECRFCGAKGTTDCADDCLTLKNAGEP